MLTFDDLASAPEHAPAPPRVPPPAPRGWEAGVVYDPMSGAMTATTSATAENVQGDPRAWHELVENLGATVPDGWRIRLVEAKYDPVAWTRETPEQDKAVTRAVWRYKFRVEPDPGSLSVDELIAVVKRHKPKTYKKTDKTGTMAYLLAMGDTQIAKMDGDGTEGTIKRVIESIDKGAEEFKLLRRRNSIGSIYLPWLGDCIEGFVSQGGGNAWRTTLTLTEQVRIIRRLMLYQMEVFRGLSDEIYLVSIPGNHDEAVRFGKGTTRYDDSWAIEAAVQVGDALATNPSAYGHCKIVVPGRDELTVTLDVAGTRVGMAHGHFWRPGQAMRWWADQAHGQQPIGDATLLLSAHLHHLRIEQGGAKTWIQLPAQESESTWWRHLKGQVAPAGAVSMLVGSGGWDHLKVL